MKITPKVSSNFGQAIIEIFSAMIVGLTAGLLLGLVFGLIPSFLILASWIIIFGAKVGLVSGLISGIIFRWLHRLMRPVLPGMIIGVTIGCVGVLISLPGVNIGLLFATGIGLGCGAASGKAIELWRQRRISPEKYLIAVLLLSGLNGALLTAGYLSSPVLMTCLTVGCSFNRFDFAPLDEATLMTLEVLEEMPNLRFATLVIEDPIKIDFMREFINNHARGWETPMISPAPLMPLYIEFYNQEGECLGKFGLSQHMLLYDYSYIKRIEEGEWQTVVSILEVPPIPKFGLD